MGSRRRWVMRGRQGGRRGAQWSNWAGNEVARPLSIEAPRDEDELAEVVREARARGESVKVIGSGHSFTPAAVTDGRMVSIGSLAGIRSVDHDRRTVTVGAGTRLMDLNESLHELGLAMPNLGDIAYQTVAGAISTSTHGTGARHTGLAAQVKGFRIVDGEGQVHQCDAEQNPDILDVARVSVGCLGAVSEYTLQMVPAFRLRATEAPMRLEQVLEEMDDHVDGNDHFEFFWVPHTRWALTKRNERTQDEPQPLPRMRGWWEKTFMENVAFGALCRVGRARPSLIPRLATALPSSGSRTYVDHSHKVFASPRLVRFYEMEQAIPRKALVPALSEIVSMVDRRGHLLNFPVEVRFTAADDVPLSTAHGRESAYIAVHVYKGMDHEPYFRDVEDILRAHGARPHWGKIHFRDHEDLADLYPRWGEFLAMRNRLDPARTFANAYSKRVFGD